MTFEKLLNTLKNQDSTTVRRSEVPKANFTIASAEGFIGSISGLEIEDSDAFDDAELFAVLEDGDPVA